MKNLLVGFLLSVVPLSVNALCLKTEDYRGTEIREHYQYQPKNSNPSDTVVDLVFDGANSGISGTTVRCLQPDTSILMMHCENYGEGKGYIDTWSVDLKNRIVFFTKHMSGYERYGLNGLSVYLGKVVGTCNM